MSLPASLAALMLATTPASECARELVVLGSGQDAGAPQIGHPDDGANPLMPSSLGLIDRKHGQRYLFDASPAITRQLAMLDAVEPPREGLGIDGIFLTHAHIGHYLGLAWLGREAAGAKGVPVYAMPRMAAFLRGNGPWSQLVEFGNIALTEMTPDDFVVANDDFGVLPIVVPHRDEYSETVGFLIMTPDKRALYLPDIDHWEGLEDATSQSLADFFATFDHVFIDATFWDDGELEGRDMSEVPHPRVKATMERLANTSVEERANIHFIHYNHTNPVRDPDSAESRAVASAGFNVAREGQSFCLSGE